jgi:hypothetical protein
LLITGDHVPVIGGVSLDDVGKSANAAPGQIGATWVKVGTGASIISTCVEGFPIVQIEPGKP